MKNLVLFLAFAVILSMMIIGVESASMPKCQPECNRNDCPTVECECGTVQDSCGCCDFCRVCPGQECRLIANDACAEGHSCSHPAGSDYMYKLSHPGTCEPTETEQ